MEKLILLLLSADSINLPQTARYYVCHVDYCNQDSPTLEPKISYLENFKIRFRYDDYNRLAIFYDYDVEVTDLMFCLSVDHHLPVNKNNQFHFDGSFVFHAYYFSDLQIPDFSEIRKQIVNDNYLKLGAKLENYCITLFNDNQNIIDAALKAQLTNL